MKFDPQLEEDCSAAAEFLIARLLFLGIQVDPVLGYVSREGGLEVVLSENHVRCAVRIDFQKFLEESPEMASRLTPRMVGILLKGALMIVSTSTAFSSPPPNEKPGEMSRV